MNKARIQKIGDNSVSYHLPEDHPLNIDLRPITREFFIPPGGGYVREYDLDKRFPQVCQYLDRRGQTLSAANTEELLALVRTEHHRALSYKRRHDTH